MLQEAINTESMKLPCFSFS